MQRADQSESASSTRPPRRSVDTHASGIAESAASFNSFVTDESLSLSRFPPPPTEIPTPRGSQAGTPLATPTRSAFNVTVLSRGHFDSYSPARSNFSVPSPTGSHFHSGTPTRSAFNASPPVTPRQDRFSTGSRSTQSLLGAPERNASPSSSRGHALPAPTPSSPLSRHIPDTDVLYDEPASHPSTFSRVTSSPETNRVQRPLPTPPTSGNVASPYDWHEGSSNIVVDNVEDKLLSTSFITRLLASTDNFPETASQRERVKSITSIITYPPSSPYPSSSDSPFRPANPLPPSPSFQTYSTRPLPNAHGELGTPLPTLKRHSGDSETLYSHSDPPQASVIRTASTAKLGARGASVLGYAPATLRQVSRNSSAQASDSSLVPPSIFSKGAGGNLPSAVGLEEEKYNYEPPLASSTVGADGRDYLLPRTRMSTQSVRTDRSAGTFVSSLFSRLSHRHQVERVKNWFRVKPLPSVPQRARSPVSADEAHRRRAETSMPLPDLLHRAGALQDLLDRGIHPHLSVDGKARPLSSASPGRSRDLPNTPTTEIVARRKKVTLVAGLLIVLALAGIVVGLVVGLNNRESAPMCQGNLTGAACTLDATCVCTSSITGQCNELAQGLISLTPTLNSLFRTNYTSYSLASAIWQAQGAPAKGNCASQARLVDVAPELDSSTHPNRTLWAQTALLWNLVKSQDLNAADKMRSFIAVAPWKSLPRDGPIADDAGSFQVLTSGFTFDFAAQTVTQPSVSFVSDGQPSTDQIAEVGPVVRPVLDRMYSYALASSTQQQQAMAKYWRTVLQQKPEDLALFISAISSSPILIPFDATATEGTSAIADLMTNSTSAPFPPPQACYPGLTPGQVRRLESVEKSVFGLPDVPTASDFDPKCFSDRPLYGVLNIARLRLPFVDSRSGVPKQAAILDRGVAPRAVVLHGELGMSSLKSTNNTDAISTEMDPRQFGTLNHLNHVILNYLTSIPDVNNAIALVKFILSSPAVPPTNATTLFSSLSSIPPLEVALFGSITPSDIAAATSSLTTTTGSLFFGSDDSLTLRRWAINAVQGPVVWTDTAVAPLVVRDSSFDDAAFNSVWEPAFTFVHSRPTGVTVGVSNITTAFRSTGKYSP